VSVLTVAVTRLLLAPALMVAAAMLVKGYVDVGDGFSAAVVVTLAVALQYLVLGARRTEEEIPLLRHAPRAAIAGLLIALASGFFPLLFGDPVFTHAPGHGDRPIHVGRLELMTPVLFDVGVFLLVAGALIALIHHLAEPPELEAEADAAPPAAGTAAPAASAEEAVR
jgi:multicomponent Na+:H+ antiporter subunit B